MCIFSDSICKPIDMVEFSKHCKHKTTIKRSFPGATASQLKHYVKPTLIEDSPDIAIIHIGTNNLTKKKHQSEVDIFNEIMEVVTECHLGGVNEIYVSSLTCRPTHEIKINSVNKLLSQNAYTYDYQYIENSNIKLHHLRDGVHHNRNGTKIIANNFLEYVNRSAVYNSTWD